MNVTIAVPMTNGMIERRRATHTGVVGLKLELEDGTQIEITEQDGGIVVLTPDPHAVHVEVLEEEPS